MDKNNAIKTLNNQNNKKVIEVEMLPGQYLKEHSHDWAVDIIILSGSLQVRANDKTTILQSGDRYKLDKDVIHTEYSGFEGVKFLSARPIDERQKN